MKLIPEKAESFYQRGILHQLQHLPTKQVSMEDMIQAFRDLFNGMRVDTRPMKIQLPADDYSMLSDEDFKAFVTNDTHKFIGGWIGYNKMMERCKRLGIC